MAVGAPYILYAHSLIDLLNKRRMDPMDLLRDMRAHMKEHAPGKSTLYMALNGQKKLPEEANTFLKNRYGYDPHWKVVTPVEENDAPKKFNQLTFRFRDYLR